MSKPVKSLVTEDLRSRFDGVDSACVVDLSGMTVLEQEALRRQLRQKSARLRVVKNSLARRAWKDTALEPVGQALEGPCALVTTSESLIDAARVLVEVAKEFGALDLKYAIIEGDSSLLSVEDLSKMKGRLELLADVAMLLASPGRAIAGCLAGPQSRIAGCLKTIVEKAA